MNKEEIEKRLKTINEAIEKQNALIAQQMANLNMLEGGKQECLYWLNLLNNNPP